MARLFLVVLSVASAACAEVRERDEARFPADRVWSVFADDDRGDLAYAGYADAGEFVVAFDAWGRGATRSAAARRAESNRWGAAVEGEQLDAWGRSEARRAGVDLSMAGPRVVDVELLTLEGMVELTGVDGFHRLTGTEVAASGIQGDLDALAYEGMDVTIRPYEGSVVRLETWSGDLYVTLPVGLPYDLRLAADPRWSYELDDLGFDRIDAGPGFAFASTAEGSVVVELVNHDGPIFVRAR